MASRIINHNLRVSSELVEQMDPMELSSLNELLDRIAALGVAMNYDRIGLKPDRRDIRSPLATHEAAIVEEPRAECPSTLRMNYVRIDELLEPKICSEDILPQVPDLESGIGPKESGSIPDSVLLGLEPPALLGVRSDHNPDSANNTYLDLNCLSRIRQEPQETVHHYWARFLLALNKVKDCREENMVSLFCKNCTDEGLLNAISRRRIIHFTDLAIIVRKYCAMESAWKTQTEFWDSTALTKTFV